MKKKQEALREKVVLITGAPKEMCKFSPFGLTMTKQTLRANLQISSFQAAIELENRNQILLGHTNKRKQSRFKSEHKQ